MQIFQEQKPVQQQRPQMYAAVEILQLDVCQLQSYINTALLENPTLECGAAPGVSLLDDLSAGGHAAAGEDAEHMQPDFADRDAVAYGEDLTTHLQFQAERLSLEPELQRAVLAVIHALDADGYLRADVSALGLILRIGLLKLRKHSIHIRQFRLNGKVNMFCQPFDVPVLHIHSRAVAII